jgi:hypothetical protein
MPVSFANLRGDFCLTSFFQRHPGNHEKIFEMWQVSLFSLQSAGIIRSSIIELGSTLMFREEIEIVKSLQDKLAELRRFL